MVARFAGKPWDFAVAQNMYKTCGEGRESIGKCIRICSSKCVFLYILYTCAMCVKYIDSDVCTPVYTHVGACRMNILLTTQEYFLPSRTLYISLSSAHTYIVFYIHIIYIYIYLLLSFYIYIPSLLLYLCAHSLDHWV